ncbi:MAG: hypothetical protein HRT90_05070 [Candidatus Margulisbacteria bacterium]|nr:hypothetical protein [Candidatus Margulisiibacteriota bacterium]
MIIVKIPPKFESEKNYIVSTLLDTFLGIRYKIESANTSKYEFVLPNNHTLCISDDFFKNYDEKEISYLQKNALPKSKKVMHSPIDPKASLECLYGNTHISVQTSTIQCDIDIIASAFFMLTRWEEHVNKNRDQHNRFPVTESIAYKHDFLDRPIVNEYVEFIWSCLQHLGYDGKRKERQFKMYLTHDVDNPYRWGSFVSGPKAVLGDLFKRKSVSLAFQSLKSFYKTRILFRTDPYDTFDWIMQLSKDHGLTSSFFFMSGGTSKYDNFYKITSHKIRKLMQRISAQGHSIGFHPSYNSYNNQNQFHKEKRLLEGSLGQKVSHGRQHYLRFEAPKTWQIWEDAGLKVDSTLGYPEKAGFRCGVCYEFPVFNFLTRQPLKLIERRLIAMEGSFVDYQRQRPSDMKKSLNKLHQMSQKYNGQFVLLWHNSALNESPWVNYQEVYRSLLVKTL